jgi:hypothetical protein
VVLFNDVVEVLYLSQFNACFMLNVVIFNRRGVGTTLVDGDLLRQATLLDGFA